VNWIDGVAVAVIATCAFKGANRGAVWQLAAVATLVLAAVFTAQLTPYVVAQLPESVDPDIRPWVAIGVVYLGLSFVVYLLAGRVRAWFEKSRFVEFDRHWGAILGAIKGGAIVMAIVLVVEITLPRSRSEIRRSRCGAVTKFSVERLLPLMPEWVSEMAGAAFKDEAFGPDSGRSRDE